MHVCVYVYVRTCAVSSIDVMKSHTTIDILWKSLAFDDFLFIDIVVVVAF